MLLFFVYEKGLSRLLQLISAAIEEICASTAPTPASGLSHLEEKCLVCERYRRYNTMVALLLQCMRKAYLEEERGNYEFNEVDLRQRERGVVAIHQRGHWEPQHCLPVSLGKELLGHRIRPPAPWLVLTLATIGKAPLKKRPLRKGVQRLAPEIAFPAQRPGFSGGFRTAGHQLEHTQCKR